MAISATELGIIVNAVGFVNLHWTKIEAFAKVVNSSRPQPERDDAETNLKDEIRKAKRLINTLITRNSITDEVRTYTDQNLRDFRILQD